ncbi:MAG TPA: hypothetical protein VEC35_01320 [Noviherbaspirillum sp.]|nr:hypothetical protein [Noviherbaspirillum sp.]
MKKAKFLVSHFDAGVEKFKAGEAYDLTDETRLCITRGAAVEVDAMDDVSAKAAAAEQEASSDAAEAQAATTDESAPTQAPAGKKTSK